ncbi:MAG: hypothetical protein SO015_11400 [Wujia sp.]|nr:hypothetical protein [Wujia sp.]MDY3728740.1 hypothetical protein [Wujia sp.]
MDNRNRWKLCGGTFFILISNARKQMPSKGEMYTGKKSGITEPETLMSLARIVTPDIEEPTSLENKSMRDGTSDFKACRGWGWRQFLLGDMAAKKSFDERMKNDYQGCLAQMTEFTNKYLDLRTDTHKDVFLVKALLELLDADGTIDGDTKFYAEKSGETITKDELLGQSTICLELFLLGLWHYCIVEVKKNSIGQETYKEWCPPTEGNNERPYEAAIGENSNRELKLTYCYPSDFDIPKEADEKDGNGSPESEVIDAIPEPDEQSAQQSLEQTINQPKVFNFHFEQSGKGTQIGFVENYYEKDEED